MTEDTTPDRTVPRPDGPATDPAFGGCVVETHLLHDDGRIPNNDRLPLLLYRGALPAELGRDLAADFEARFGANGWGDGWRDSIYDHHHYHATAHEALGIASGRARVQFGGDRGPVVEVASGDAVVIPAGVGHRNLGASEDFLVVGAYPPGQVPDMNRGLATERPGVLAAIPRVGLPDRDPLFGPDGPLIRAWRS